jgi:hypothetical protein
VRLLLRKRKEHQQESWAVFIDLVKAFDAVNREFLWAVLLRFGRPDSFVDRLRVLHKDVIVVLRKDGEEVRLRSEGGARQGDILGPPLFLIFVAMVSVVREVEKNSPDVTMLTCPHERIILHGRRGTGGNFNVNDSCYADDAGLLKISREDLDHDVPEDDAHLRLAGLEMHTGRWLADSVLPSKTEAMFFPKQAICYEDFDAASGVSPTFDGVDLSDIAVSASAGAFVPFCSEFCYLGSMLNMDLTDIHDVRNRVRKGHGCFLCSRSLSSAIRKSAGLRSGWHVLAWSSWCVCMGAKVGRSQPKLSVF